MIKFESLVKVVYFFPGRTEERVFIGRPAAYENIKECCCPSWEVYAADYIASWGEVKWNLVDEQPCLGFATTDVTDDICF